MLFTVVEGTGSGRTADRLAARFRAFNAGVRATAKRHGAVLVDLAAVPVLRDRRLWHADRLHLAPEGHARVAAAVLDALGVEQSDWWRSELPGSARATPGGGAGRGRPLGAGAPAALDRAPDPRRVQRRRDRRQAPGAGGDLSRLKW